MFDNIYNKVSGITKLNYVVPGNIYPLWEIGRNLQSIASILGCGWTLLGSEDNCLVVAGIDINNHTIVHLVGLPLDATDIKIADNRFVKDPEEKCVDSYMSAFDIKTAVGDEILNTPVSTTQLSDEEMSEVTRFKRLQQNNLLLFTKNGECNKCAMKTCCPIEGADKITQCQTRAAKALKLLRDLYKGSETDAHTYPAVSNYHKLRLMLKTKTILIAAAGQCSHCEFIYSTTGCPVGGHPRNPITCFEAAKTSIVNGDIEHFFPDMSIFIPVTNSSSVEKKIPLDPNIVNYELRAPSDQILDAEIESLFYDLIVPAKFIESLEPVTKVSVSNVMKLPKPFDVDSVTASLLSDKWKELDRDHQFITLAGRVGNTFNYIFVVFIQLDGESIQLMIRKLHVATPDGIRSDPRHLLTLPKKREKIMKADSMNAYEELEYMRLIELKNAGLVYEAAFGQCSICPLEKCCPIKGDDKKVECSDRKEELTYLLNRMFMGKQRSLLESSKVYIYRRMEFMIQLGLLYVVQGGDCNYCRFTRGKFAKGKCPAFSEYKCKDSVGELEVVGSTFWGDKKFTNK